MHKMYRISEGNSKLGKKLPNFSLAPGLSCSNGAQVTCFLEGCYAAKFFKMYPNVRDAWGDNYELASTKTSEFADEMSTRIASMAARFFRIHVGGDFFNQEYLNQWIRICNENPFTRFLAFTKQYHLNYDNVPENMVVIWSMWPSIGLPEGWEEFPTAWLEEDERRPEGYHFVCPNNCSEDVCDHQCWQTVRPDLPVIFKKH